MIPLHLLKATLLLKFRISPFLAFRGYHELGWRPRYWHQSEVQRKCQTAPLSALYPQYDPLYSDSKKSEFVPAQMVYNVEYIHRARERGYNYQRNLYVPGYFRILILKKENPWFFLQGLTEADPKTRTNALKEKLLEILEIISKHVWRILQGQFYTTSRWENAEIIAGYPWVLDGGAGYFFCSCAWIWPLQKETPRHFWISWIRWPMNSLVAFPKCLEVG